MTFPEGTGSTFSAEGDTPLPAGRLLGMMVTQHDTSSGSVEPGTTLPEDPAMSSMMVYISLKQGDVVRGYIASSRARLVHLLKPSDSSVVKYSEVDSIVGWHPFNIVLPSSFGLGYESSDEIPAGSVTIVDCYIDVPG